MNKATDESIDQIFFALSDKSRRNMLLRLTKGSLSVTELGEPLGITKQAVSKHLQVLEKAKMITKQKDGRIQSCSYNPEALDLVHSVIEQYRKFWNQQLDGLEDYIEKLKRG